MSVHFIEGVAEIAADYDLYLVDLWGVVHDGVTLYPGVEDCLMRLRGIGKRVVLLSNAPRPNNAVREQIAGYGAHAGLYDEVITSGDLTQAALRERPDDWHRSLGRRYYHLGPPTHASLIEGIPGKVESLDEADYLLSSGVVDDHREEAEDYRDFLRDCIDRGLKMICANPDVVVMRGARMLPCAGALAALYEELGGEVARHGKPYAGAYETALRHAGGIPRARGLMVGDTFHTDITGGHNAGMGTLWVAGGVHRRDVDDGQGGYDRSRAAALIAGAESKPDHTIFQFSW